MLSQADVAAPARTRAWPASLLALVVVLGVGFPGPERAEARPALNDGARARLEAQSLAALGRYGEACDKFEESQRAHPAVATQWSLADCWNRAGRAASAWALYRQLAAENGSSAETKRLATARAAAIEPRLGYLQVHVTRALADRLHVSVDGVALPPQRWGGDLRVDVGRHRVSARAPGHRSWQQVVEVPAGGSLTRIDVPVLEVGTSPLAMNATPAAPRGPLLADPPIVAEEPAPPSYTAAYVAGGIGLAGLTVGALSGWLASSQSQRARKLCAGTREGCPPSLKDDREALKRYADDARNVSHVALGVGAAGVVAGAALLYVTRKKALEQANKVTLSPNIGTSGVGVSLSGTF